MVGVGLRRHADRRAVPSQRMQGRYGLGTDTPGASRRLLGAPRVHGQLPVEPRPPALVLGVPVDDVTMNALLDRIAHLVDHGRLAGRSHQIATVNVDFVSHALRQPEIADLLGTVELCIPDGQPLVWGARWCRTPLQGRVAGSDLVPLLAQRAEIEGWRVHFFGGTEQATTTAAGILRARHPELVLTADPGPVISDPDRVEPEVIDRIASVGADVICVALGHPKQEQFIRTYGDRLGASVLLGVGGSLDLIGGTRRRAPSWMQRLGVEWLFRAVQEPRRLGPRYARDAVRFGPSIVRQAVVSWRFRHGAGLSFDTHVRSGRPTVAVSVASTVADLASWARTADAVRAGAVLELDLERLPVLHPAAIAQVVGLARLAAPGSIEIGGTPSPGLGAQLVALRLPPRLLRPVPSPAV